MEGEHFKKCGKSCRSISDWTDNGHDPMKKVRGYIFPLFFLILLGVSYLSNFAAGEEVGVKFWMFFKEMILFLPLMFILIGLFDVWVPREKIGKHIGKDSGGRERDW
ncbi:MAG: hypothetical protein U5L72_08180 [Bacteroidales bacterium]|nr:hypothetical protein [Bacteroidales bacterium]